MIKSKILKSGKKVEKNIIDIRREIHKYPELSNVEFKTSELIKKELKNLDLEVIEFENLTGVMGVLKGTKSKEKQKTILVRADIDALPMQEKNECSFKSEVKNVMHSCGHDAHTASLLGTIKILVENKDEINGTIKFLFQHAEETGTGAKELVDKNILNNPKVDAVLGYHIMPIPENKIGIKDNSMCASSNIFEIIIKGTGGHGAYPHNNVNPVNIGAQIIQSIPNFIVNKFSAVDSLVINVCTFTGGEKDNIVPDSARISGTIRALRKTVEIGRAHV